MTVLFYRRFRSWIRQTSLLYAVGMRFSDDTDDDPSYFKPYGESLQIIYHDVNGHFAGFPSHYEINGGNSYFYPQEVEVFQIIYNEE